VTTPEYWALPLEQLYAALDTSPEGLRTSEAGERARRCAGDALSAAPRADALRLLARQYTSPLVAILLAGAGVSLLLAEWLDAGIILAIVAGSTLLGFSQEYRASLAIAELRRRLALTSRVKRDGAWRSIPASEVVPGDVIELTAGNLVPADSVLIEARDFLVSEAALTGESFPVEKRPGACAADAALNARGNCAFMGTSVRSGTALAVVCAIGRATAFGAISARLEQAPPPTEFERGIRRFGYLLLQVMLVTVVFVLIVNQALGRPAIESLLFATALAVGLSPELLPAIMSVTLSHGASAMAREGVLVRRLQAIEDLGGMEVLCTDKTGTLTHGVIALNAALDPEGHPSKEVAYMAYLNAALETGIENPLDAAIVEAGRRDGIELDSGTKVDEIPYDFMRKRLTIVVRDAGGDRLVTKGAFENVLACCSNVATSSGAVALDAPRREALQAFYRERGIEGFRVLGLAFKLVPGKARYSREDESGLCFAGFLLFFDPPKPQAASAVQDLAKQGIRVCIVTGDNRYVAAHVARAIGMDESALLTGEDLSRMKDEALWQAAEGTTVFAEVDPQQKERIVRALQHRGRAVGFLGDGINDAPAMHAADIGISVDSAVDVARESADVVLLGPDLEVLRQGVLAGRGTFANTIKYISITTSANFGNMMSMAVATPLLPFLPLTAKQILLNNFLSDLPSIAISTDGVDPEVVEHPQRWDVARVRRFMVVFGLVSTGFDLVTFFVLLGLFKAGESEFQTAWFVLSLLTELAVVLSLRTRRPAWRSRPSGILVTITVAVGILAVFVPYVPLFDYGFGFLPLPATLLGALLLILVAYLACTELVKRLFFSGRS
jgi:Mg2+-importing ATPase